MRGALAFALGAALCACSSPEPPREAVPSDPEGASARRTVTATTTGETPVFVAPARLLPAPGASARIEFLAEGTVQEVRAQPGDRVEAGEVVFRIGSPPLARSAGQRVSALRRLRIARERLERLRQLADEQIASRDALEARRAEVTALASEAASLRGELAAYGVEGRDVRILARAGRLDVRSPIAGVVRRLEVEVGQRVGRLERPLAEIVGAGPARLEALLPEPPHPGLAYVFVGSEGARHPAGEVKSALPDPDTGAYRVWLSMPGLRVTGARVGELHALARGPNVVALPTEAVGLRDGQRFVLLEREGERTRVPVELLHLDPARAVVQGALRPGDQVLAHPRAQAEGG